MIASVLVISRVRRHTRAKMIHRFLDNVREHTTDMSDIEILIRIDDDDYESAESLANVPDVKVIIGPRVDGYRSVPDMYIELSKIAQGTWLGLFSDDLLIETKGWDKILYDYNQYTTHLLKPQHPKVFGGNLTPIMHRNLFELVGHCGIYPADWWWDILGVHLPLHIDIPVIVEHIGSGIEGDTVEGTWSNANHEETFDKGQADRTTELIVAYRRAHNEQ